MSDAFRKQDGSLQLHNGISRQASTFTETVDQIPEQNLRTPPDGGIQAWMQVLMGHLVLINGWGYLTSFGIFQSHYALTLDASPSAISWIGSIQIFLVYLIGTFSGRALDAGYYHAVLAVGSALQILGVFMTSIASRVLAALPSPRSLQGARRWIGLLSDSVPGGDLFFEEPRGGYGVYCVWRCDRGYYLPSHGTAIALEDWICLDRSDHGFRDIT